TQGKYDEADPLYLRAIEIGEKTLGPDHPDLATRLNNRARTFPSYSRASTNKPILSMVELLRSGRRRWALTTPNWRKDS
ncbi:unnamed protein product, partial [Ectocarpus sp. 12 AP-2014]